MLQRAETPAALAGVDAARAFFAGCVGPLADDDTLWVAHLDDRSRCIHLQAYPHSNDHVSSNRAILSDAATLGSSGLLLAHRRPGSESRPDRRDRTSAQDLAIAAEACDLTLVDHLIFAGETCTSMRRMGLL
jgi:DNA repair protein RadC